jgi:hypothetical protein
MLNDARREKISEVEKQKSLSGLERVGPFELEKYSGDTSRGPQHPRDPLGKTEGMVLKMEKYVNACL